MAKQLVYTSAPKGIWPGSSGYCTVLASEGLQRAQTDFLETLSLYRIVDKDSRGSIAPTPQNAERLKSINPPNFCHLRFQYRSQVLSVLLKTCLAGLDYSNRLRKLSHYLIVEDQEKCQAGPVWLVSQNGLFLGDWGGDPMRPSNGKTIPSGQIHPKACKLWQQVAGDAGWAGVLADTVVGKTRKPVYLLINRSIDAPQLLLEASSIVPPHLRWDITFSTNYVELPSAVDCLWRCVDVSSPEAASLAKSKEIVAIDLTSSLPPCPSTPGTEAARNGVYVDVPAPVFRKPVEVITSSPGPGHRSAKQHIPVPGELHSSAPPIRRPRKRTFGKVVFWTAASAAMLLVAASTAFLALYLQNESPEAKPVSVTIHTSESEFIVDFGDSVLDNDKDQCSVFAFYDANNEMIPESTTGNWILPSGAKVSRQSNLKFAINATGVTRNGDKLARDESPLPEKITFRVTDRPESAEPGKSASDNAAFVITFSGHNTRPIVENGTFDIALLGDEQKNVGKDKGLLRHAKDPDNEELKIFNIKIGSHSYHPKQTIDLGFAELVVSENGSYTLKPQQIAIPSERKSFTIEFKDDYGLTNSAEMTFVTRDPNVDDIREFIADDFTSPEFVQEYEIVAFKRTYYALPLFRLIAKRDEIELETGKHHGFLTLSRSNELLRSSGKAVDLPLLKFIGNEAHYLEPAHVRAQRLPPPVGGGKWIWRFKGKHVAEFVVHDEAIQIVLQDSFYDQVPRRELSNLRLQVSVNYDGKALKPWEYQLVSPIPISKDRWRDGNDNFVWLPSPFLPGSLVPVNSRTADEAVLLFARDEWKK